MGLDLIFTIGGLLIPPVFDFLKKKFLKGSDTPEATMSTLATTKPEALEGYVNALANYMQAQVSYFNRDVVGEVPRFVSALRACIRPAVVVIGLVHLTAHGIFGERMILDEGIRYFYEANISSWFGTKMNKE